jgi:putative ATP-binding cassette transporter
MSLRLAFWALFRMLARGPGGGAGFPLFGVVAALRLLSIPIGLYLIQWNADFFNALQRVDASAAIHQIGVFGIITLVSATRVLAADYLTKRLQIRWRTTLTSVLLDRWLADHTYWRIEQAGADTGTDNPDQRIAEDSRIFIEKLTGETLDIITAVVALFTYVPLLWSLSNFPLQVSLLGIDFVIEHYMVWAAPAYVALSSGITHFLGAPLIRLSVEQQRREADFRFSLARAREYAEPIALAGGEGAERKVFDDRYAGVIGNFRRLINRELILGVFTRPYMQTVLQIPLFLALPAFLAGQVALGGLMQLRSAFQQVVTNLSYFIFSYRDLADLAAAVRRLGLFIGDLDVDRLVSATRDERIARRVVDAHEPLAWSNLVLSVPGGERLLKVPDVTLGPGEHIWISGSSGIGKSTLIKALGGLWRRGSGLILVPEDSVMILPQRIYIPINGPAAAAIYPSVQEYPPEAVYASLHSLNLGSDVLTASHSFPAKGQIERSRAGVLGSTLSGGEQQRLMLARLLLARPRVAVLDEPSGALDEASERHVFATLQSLLPDTTFVVVAHHRPPCLAFRHEIHLER